MKIFSKLSLKVALWLLKKGYASLDNIKPYVNYHREDYHHLDQHDVNTGAAYDKSDYSLVNQYFSNIRAASFDKILKTRLIGDYHYHIYRAWNDHHIPRNKKLPETVGVCYHDDRVVFDGLERNALLITGKSNRYMTHYAIGAGLNVNTAQVKPGENKIDDEIAREDMRTRGFADAKGSSIAFGVIYGLNVPTATITNSGVTDGPVDNFSTLYLRTNYIGSNRITVTFGQTFGAFTSIIYQRSA